MSKSCAWLKHLTVLALILCASACGGGSLGTGIRPFDGRKIPERKVEFPWVELDKNPCREMVEGLMDDPEAQERCAQYRREKALGAPNR